MLASGSGTNLQALLDTPGIRERIVIVVSDRPAAALDRAEQAGIPAAMVAYRDFPDRATFTEAVADVVEQSGAKGVVLAGFMRVLAPSFIERFPNRILNIHPSLLPAFPGHRAVEEALEQGVEVTGVTVHFVDEEVDHGPIVAQQAVRVEPDDTALSLHGRIQAIEHVLYPQVVKAFVDGRLSIEDGEVVRR